jgi:hypothetical protein
MNLTNLHILLATALAHDSIKHTHVVNNNTITVTDIKGYQLTTSNIKELKQWLGY